MFKARLIPFVMLFLFFSPAYGASHLSKFIETCNNINFSSDKSLTNLGFLGGTYLACAGTYMLWKRDNIDRIIIGTIENIEKTLKQFPEFGTYDTCDNCYAKTCLKISQKPHPFFEKSETFSFIFTNNSIKNIFFDKKDPSALFLGTALFNNSCWYITFFDLIFSPFIWIFSKIHEDKVKRKHSNLISKYTKKQSSLFNRLPSKISIFDDDEKKFFKNGPVKREFGHDGKVLTLYVERGWKNSSSDPCSSCKDDV